MTDTPKPKTALEIQYEATQKKLEQLKARMNQAAAKQRAKASKKERDADTKRKILIGSYVLSTQPMENITRLMDGYLTRDSDRAAFGLPPKAVVDRE